jgi:hypothetical protein
MAKKAAAPKAPQTADSTKQLIEAIVTVKQLQNFIGEHGSLEKALAAVVRVEDLVDLTKGFGPLKQALEIVGKKEEPPVVA